MWFPYVAFSETIKLDIRTFYKLKAIYKHTCDIDSLFASDVSQHMVDFDKPTA